MRDADFEAYVKTAGWNASLIKVAISESLAAAQWQRTHDIDTDTSNRKKLRAFHCAVLEGSEAFARKFWVHDLSRSTNEFKKLKPGMEALGKTDIKTAEADTAHLVAGSIHAHRHAGRYFDGQQRVEQVVTWTDPQTGLPCKAMLDLLSPVDGGVLLDLKNLRGIKGEQVWWQTRSLLWHAQLAHYRDGCIHGLGVTPSKVGILGFTEKHGHVEVGIWWLDRVLQVGDDLRRKALGEIAEAERTGIWPRSQAEPESLDDYSDRKDDDDFESEPIFGPEGWSTTEES